MIPPLTPELSRQSNSTHFNIYLAKDLYDPNWKNQFLKDKVQEARSTYRDYYSQNLPFFDEYDSKSAVYLVQIGYWINDDDGEFEVEEWISMRFLPTDGNPPDSLDFQLQEVVNGISRRHLIDAMSETLVENGDTREFFSEVISFSRFCAIRPKSLDQRYQQRLNLFFEKHFGRVKNLFTASAFGLTLEAFREYLIKIGRNYKWISCQIHERVKNDVLKLDTKEGIKYWPFKLAEETLQLPDNQKIRINRDNNELYIYSYPGYFLSLEDLTRELSELIMKGKLSGSLVFKYFPQLTNWQASSELPHVTDFRNLGVLLTKSGPLPDSQLTGEELRDYLNKTVADNAKLYLMNFNDFFNANHQICELI